MGKTIPKSEWLHERDDGNKAAGQVKPMGREGTRMQGERTKRPSIL